MIRDTLTDQLHEAIRTDIVLGRLVPETIIRTHQFTDRYGVSATPLREALQRLAIEGLVELESRRGVRIPPLSVSGVRDIYRVRRLIETEMLKEAMELGDHRWLERVEATYEDLMSVGEPALPPDPRREEALEIREARFLAWRERHRRFHATLLEPCRSAWLHRIYEILVNHAERYVFASVSSPLRDRQTTGEHAELFQAVARRDVQAAVAAHVRHLDGTLASVERLLGHAQARVQAL